MSKEQVSAAQLYEEYSPKVKPSSSIYYLWKQIEDSFDFRDQPEEIQFLQLLKRYNDTILSMPGADPIDLEEVFIKKELRREGFKILCDDFFKTLKRGEIVEILTLDNMQLYRNFEYFKYSSYSIRELISRPWTELFSRHEKYMPNIYQQIMKTIELKPTEYREMKIPVHRLQETAAKRYTFEVTYRHSCPVVDRYGNKTALAVSQAAKRVEDSNLIPFH